MLSDLLGQSKLPNNKESSFTVSVNKNDWYYDGIKLSDEQLKEVIRFINIVVKKSPKEK